MRSASNRYLGNHHEITQIVEKFEKWFGCLVPSSRDHRGKLFSGWSRDGCHEPLPDLFKANKAMKNEVFLPIFLHNLMLNHVVMTQKFFNWHLNDNIFIQNVRICPSQTTFVIFGSYFQSHNMNLSSWSYSWIKPLASRLVDPIPVSWFSLADFGELNP